MKKQNTTKNENVVTTTNTTTNENNVINQFGELEPVKVVLRDLQEKVEKQEMDEKERLETNREAAKEAKEKALQEAIERYNTKLENMDAEEKLHFYFANPYVVYRYNYIMYTKDGQTTNRENAGEFKIKLSALLSKESYTELNALIVNFRRIMVAISNLHADNNQDARELRAIAKKQLENIFQSLATEKYKKMYVANHNDLQRIFNNSFTIDKMQYDRKLNKVNNDKTMNVIDNENMINLITWALSQRLNDKNGFINMPSVNIATEEQIKAEVKAS